MSDQLQARLNKLQDVLGKVVTLEPSRKGSAVEPEASIRNSSSSDWQEQYLTHAKSSGDAVPSRPVVDGPVYQALDDSKLCIGDSLGAHVAFCPFKTIETYPEYFIGNRNRPLVCTKAKQTHLHINASDNIQAQPFFDDIGERKTWHFFELRSPSDPQRSCLLVPTVQFVDFLQEVNLQLGTQLRIPKGGNEPDFSLKFGHGGTPQPRYVGTSRTDLRAILDDPWKINDDWAAFTTASAEDKSLWLANWERANAPCGYQRADQRAKFAAERAEKRKREREVMLDKVQAYLGTSARQHIRDGPSKPVLFVSIDIEVLEEEPRSISEVGIAVLDTRSIQQRDKGPGGMLWWEHIKAHHLIVRQYASHVNYKYVQGCPDKFQFGESIFPNEWELIDTLSSILSSYTHDGETDVVLVGHNVQADVQYLSNVGYDVGLALASVDAVDTQILHQAWKRGEQPRKLERVLSDLCIPYTNLHNAGNDATYTLRAMITAGVEGPMPEGQTSRRPQLAEHVLPKITNDKSDELW
ncbi:hypothetical protein E4U41_004124 [Claviceps citrina]|nr:hypothetical protein E4U41_004124 [Claviceps citrina]